MPTQPSFDDLMAQLRQGQDKAAAEVFHRFASRLVELARKHLGPRILQKEDAEDVTQSVFRSFFARNAAGQLGDFESWDNLWGLLVVMTQRKCGRRIDYFHAARRDIEREIAGLPAEDPSGSDLGVMAADPTPSEAAMLTDTLHRLLASLPPKHREIVTLTLQGYAPAEVSNKAGCTERTVYRVLERVKEWLQT